MATSDPTKRVALYLRVSTDEQTTANQRRELEEVATRAGWVIANVYEDAGISGAKGRFGRPAFNQMLKDATAREFDMIAAWAVDRLGRSLQDLVHFLDDLHSLGIDLYLHQQRLDTSTPSGRALFQMLGVFAEFERSMISERVKAGLARTTKKLGRPSGRPHKRAKEVLQLRNQGRSIREIARTLRMGVNSVHKIINVKRDHLAEMP
ncbi:MAG: resolvase [Alphaproteobacteria bacterium]|nr:resolvase [Alphaproteobacteria bacterium]